MATKISNIESLFNSLECAFKSQELNECCLQALIVSKKQTSELSNFDNHIISILSYAKKSLTSEDILSLPLNLEKAIYNVN